jgi:hypothetical protein
MNAALAFLNAAGRDRQMSGRHIVHGLLMMDVLLGTRRFYCATADHRRANRIVNRQDERQAGRAAGRRSDEGP